MQSNLKVRVTNTSHRYRLAAVAAALTVSFGAASQAGAADLNCEPDVVVENKKDISIKVLRFAYTVLNKSEPYYVESLANKRLAPGERETWPTQKLKEAADGNVITHTWVEYKPDTSGVGSPIGDPYGPADWSDDHTHSLTYACFKGRDYYVSVE
jgi:hypothetical protein